MYIIFFIISVFCVSPGVMLHLNFASDHCFDVPFYCAIIFLKVHVLVTSPLSVLQIHRVFICIIFWYISYTIGSMLHFFLHCVLYICMILCNTWNICHCINNACLPSLCNVAEGACASNLSPKRSSTSSCVYVYDIWIHLVYHRIIFYIFDWYYVTPEIFWHWINIAYFCHHCAMLLRVHVLVTSPLSTLQ